MEEVFAFLEGFTKVEKVNEREAFCINLVVEELFTNMVKHNDGGDESIAVRIERVDDCIHLEMVDCNVGPFDPASAAAVPVDSGVADRSPGGLGLHIVKTMVDEVTYDYDEKGAKETIRHMKRLMASRPGTHTTGIGLTYDEAAAPALVEFSGMTLAFASIGIVTNSLNFHRARLGNAGTAFAPMLLVSALEGARAGDRILLASYGDGGEAIVFAVGEAIDKLAPRRGVAWHLERRRAVASYEKYKKARSLETGEYAPHFPQRWVPACRH